MREPPAKTCQKLPRMWAGHRSDSMGEGPGRSPGSSHTSVIRSLVGDWVLKPEKPSQPGEIWEKKVIVLGLGKIFRDHVKLQRNKRKNYFSC